MINSKLGKNFILSISAQLVALSVSFVSNLILPKFLSELNYAYWQTYFLYTSYVGILHFGVLDGIVLKYSQFDYDTLDTQSIRSVFRLVLIADLIMGTIICFFSFITFSTPYNIIGVFVAIGIVTRHSFTYSSYTFQITNRISLYAKLIIAQKLVSLITFCVLVILRVENFFWYCICDLLSDIFACLILSVQNRACYLGPLLSFKNALNEYFDDLKSGVLLVVANWSSILIVGLGRMIVQWKWGELVFGKASFAFSVTNLFLSFVTALSIVLFPSLKRMDSEDLPEVYIKIQKILTPFMIGILLLYFPGCLVLHMWLPKYDVSLSYLGLLLPMILFTSKASLLTNNYLKALRKEKEMFIINIVCVIIAFILNYLGAFLFDNINIILVTTVIVTFIRTFLSERIIHKTLHFNDSAKFWKYSIEEIAMSVLFMISTCMKKAVVGFASYFFILFAYYLVIFFSRRYIKK